jgi:mannose-6-phosphate isomerase-like protein (cupin superfamily)
MMNISRFDKTIATPAHEGTILAMPVLPVGVKAPFGHAWGYLAGRGEMDGHTHPTMEVYFFHRGQGVVIVGDEEHPVGPGDWVEIPPAAYHTVRNDSDGELLWFALWWQPVA